MKIILAFGGRTKLAQGKEICERFCKMAGKFLPCKIDYIKELGSCGQLQRRYPNSILVGLSPEGEEMDSQGFARFLKELMGEGKNIVFAVGGAGGFSVDRCAKIISLSKMTFSHEVARIMLAEQIFRALCIIFSHPYPK